MPRPMVPKATSTLTSEKEYSRAQRAGDMSRSSHTGNFPLT